MRFYDIRMTDPDGKLLTQFGFAKFGRDTSYTSYLDGRTLTGALNIEFNIPHAPYATPQQGSWLRIWGIGLDEIARTSILGPPNGKLCGITIQGGMQTGLPLAKPGQRGVLAQGSIFKPFGNWQGTDQTLEMVLLPAVGTAAQEVNIPFSYPADTPLSDAIEQSLAAGLPKYKRIVKISPQLKLSYPAAAVAYKKLGPFSEMILKLSLQQQFQGIKPLGGGTYGGVQFRIIGDTITVYDNTVDYGGNSYSNPKKIEFEDIIGQPTWIGPNSINWKCVLRGDINVGDYISLPNSLALPYVLTTPAAAIPGAESRNNLTFKGKFIVINVRHYGNYRSPGADSWVTVYNASYVTEPGSLIANATQTS